MGHTRLGSIPKSKTWTSVVDYVLGGIPTAASIAQEVPAISAKTLAAAEGALPVAIEDAGLRFTFYLLTKVVLASRDKDWYKKLDELGIQLNHDSSVVDLTCEIQNRVDDFLGVSGERTDVGEMAQKAAGESLAYLVQTQTSDFFESDGDHLRTVLKNYSTSAGFGELGQKFFGCFMAKFLNFYLCRITATHLGHQRIGNIAEVQQFNATLQSHCEQSARIVRNFSGQWVSKTNYFEGITPQNTRRFIAVAINKLRAELNQQKVEG
jgi:hypothetical protein